VQNCGENGAAERMCRRKLAGLSEPKWRFPAPQREGKVGGEFKKFQAFLLGLPQDGEFKALICRMLFM